MAFDPAAWIKTHKPQAAAGAAVALAGAVVLAKRRSAATSAQGGAYTVPATGAAADFATGTVGAGGYDSSSNDVYDTLQPQLEALQNQVNALSTTPPATQQVPVTTNGGTDPATTTPIATPAVPTAPNGNPVIVSYQAPGSAQTEHLAAAPQATPYANGQLIYEENGRQIQTADTPQNRANIAAQGWTIVGGY